MSEIHVLLVMFCFDKKAFFNKCSGQRSRAFTDIELAVSFCATRTHVTHGCLHPCQAYSHTDIYHPCKFIELLANNTLATLLVQIYPENTTLGGANNCD